MSGDAPSTTRAATAARPLDGRAAVVTGASRGIGRETALRLAAAGARVALLARSADVLGALVHEIGDVHGVDAVALPCDVRDQDAVAAAAARATALFGGAPDILVNNAGTFPLAAVEATSPAEFARTLEANLVAPFALVHALLPGMRARARGHVVTVGSIADRVAFPENSAYAASKFGARGLHEVLRAELRGTGVRVSLVSPGPVDTSIWDAIDPDTRAGFTPRSAMLRPGDVADAILYVVTAPAAVNVDELRLSRA